VLKAQWFGRRTIFITGLASLTCLLYAIGGVTPAADSGGNGKWAQAALIMAWVFVYDISVGVSCADTRPFCVDKLTRQPLAYCIVGETSSTRLRGKTVAISRNLYNIMSVVSNVLGTYQINPTAWNWRGYTSFFWVSWRRSLPPKHSSIV